MKHLLFPFFTGQLCMDLLFKDGSWRPVTTLTEIILEVARVIDNLSPNRIQHTGS